MNREAVNSKRIRGKKGNVIFLFKRWGECGNIEKKGGKDMATVKVKCPYCGSEEVALYGKSSTGKQKYLCQNKECEHKTFLYLSIEKCTRWAAKSAPPKI